MNTRDGDHRIAKARFDLSSVLVTPLAPPFPKGSVSFQMAGSGGKDLVVSKDDAQQILKLLGGVTQHRHVTLSAVDGDDVHMRLTVTQ